MAKGKLTDKQAMFVAEYIVDFNATQAAIRAGYSKKTAGAVGYSNLKKAEIKAAIDKAIKDRMERVELNQDYVIQKLLEITEQEADDHIQSKLKYNNKIRALELLGNHLGMFNGKQEVADKVTVIIDV